MLEIEVKIEVPNLSPIRTRMDELHVIPLILEERDIYYSPMDKNFAKTDEALRVRYSNGSCSLTYKGPRMKGRSTKAREEVTVTLDSGENIEKILDSLGFLRVFEVKKRREFYQYQGAIVCIDEVEDLGSFIEIEMSSTDSCEDAEVVIEKIKETLGIKGEHIPLSYFELLLLKRSLAQPGYSSHSR